MPRTRWSSPVLPAPPRQAHEWVPVRSKSAQRGEGGVRRRGGAPPAQGYRLDLVGAWPCTRSPARTQVVLRGIILLLQLRREQQERERGSRTWVRRRPTPSPAPPHPRVPSALGVWGRPCEPGLHEVTEVSGRELLCSGGGPRPAPSHPHSMSSEEHECVLCPLCQTGRTPPILLLRAGAGQHRGSPGGDPAAAALLGDLPAAPGSSGW